MMQPFTAEELKMLMEWYAAFVDYNKQFGHPLAFNHIQLYEKVLEVLDDLEGDVR